MALDNTAPSDNESSLVPGANADVAAYSAVPMGDINDSPGRSTAVPIEENNGNTGQYAASPKGEVNQSAEQPTIGPVKEINYITETYAAVPTEEVENGSGEHTAVPVQDSAENSGEQAAVLVEKVEDDPDRAGKEKAGWLERMLLDTWVPETLALTFSASCLIAIVAILLVYNDRSLPQLPYGITLNAVISILATTSRSMLAYVVAASISQLKWCWYTSTRKLQDLQIHDDASRGPWGSMTMLVYLRARPIASIGAIVTLLALAIDPFVQQVLVYPTRMVESPEAPPAISKATQFAVDPASEAWSSAIQRGIFSEASQFDRRPACPTGNCTWPDFKSIGWCKKCEDITPQLSLLNCNTSILEMRNYVNDSLACVLQGSNDDRIPLLTSVANNFYSPFTVSRPQYQILTEVIWPLGTWTTDTAQLLKLDNLSFFPGSHLDVPHPLVSMGHFVMAGDLEGTFNLTVGKAEGCVLSLCSTESSVAVQNGTARSTVVGHKNFGYTDGYTFEDGEDGTDRTCWKRKKDTFVRTHGVQAECNTTISGEDYFCPPGLGRNICEDYTELDYAISLLDHLTGNRTRALGTESSIASEVSSPVIQYVAAHGLGGTLDGVAAALSQLALSGTDTIEIPGTGMISETYVHARLYWLALPLALEVGGIVSLLFAIFQSRRRGVRLWKESLLPLLFHGLEQSALDQLMSPEPASAMSSIADRVKVRLGQSSTGEKSVLEQM